MKRALLLALLLTLAGWFQAARHTANTAAFTPVAHVQLRDCHTGEISWRTVDSHGRHQAGEPFAVQDCWSQLFRYPRITLEDGGISNPMSDMSLSEDELPLLEDPIISRILAHVAVIPHDVMEARVLHSADQWFLCVSLNVNWTYPWHLYRYHPQADSMTHLCVFDAQEVTAILPADDKGGLSHDPH